MISTCVVSLGNWFLYLVPEITQFIYISSMDKIAMEYSRKTIIYFLLYVVL